MYDAGSVDAQPPDACRRGKHTDADHLISAAGVQGLEINIHHRALEEEIILPVSQAGTDPGYFFPRRGNHGNGKQIRCRPPQLHGQPVFLLRYPELHLLISLALHQVSVKVMALVGLVAACYQNAAIRTRGSHI